MGQVRVSGPITWDRTVSPMRIAHDRAAYLSAMRPLFRLVITLSLLAIPALLSAQRVEVHTKEDVDLPGIGRVDIYDGNTEVPGLGDDVPGLKLSRISLVRHFIGDSSAFADRDFVDSTWMSLSRSRDSVAPGIAVHWVRLHFLPDADLRSVPLLLSVGARADVQVFLNGHLLLRSTDLNGGLRAGTRYENDKALRTFIPFSFRGDGKAEAIAIRLSADTANSLRAMEFDLSIHPADVLFQQQRRIMHYGLFIGINIIILLFSLVMWKFERRERTWLLLALLSLVSVLGIVCDVGSDMGALGIAGEQGKVLRFISILITLWPLYLLLLVLRVLQGDTGRKLVRWYTVAAVLSLFICTAYAIIDVSIGLEDVDMNDLSIPLIFSFIAGAMLFGAVAVFFIVEALRQAIRLLRSKGAVRWIGLGALASTGLSFLLKIIGSLFGTGLDAWLELVANYFAYVGVPVSVAIYLAIRSAHHNRLVSRQRDELDEEVKERTAELRTEKERSDELLLNILPEEVAEELKAKGSAEAQLIEQVTVLFTDFKGFTAMSEQLSPKELVKDLHECFSAFDAIMEKHGIEKIKTIGDAYMAAGGLPDKKRGSPLQTVLAALEMHEFMQAYKQQRIAEGRRYFEMRTGLHTGPVIAGIVGVKKYAYDIWGDTVNVANRMETSGEVAKVNISQTTYDLVKDEPGLRFIPRGAVPAKGKGMLNMYFVERA